MLNKSLKELDYKQKTGVIIMLVAVFLAFFSTAYVIRIVFFSPPFTGKDYKNLCVNTILMGGKMVINGEDYKAISMGGLQLFRNGACILDNKVYFGITKDKGVTTFLSISGYFRGQSVQSALTTILFDDNNDGVPDRKEVITLKGADSVIEFQPLEKEDFTIWDVWIVRLIEAVENF